jgi:hypothetical protein
MNLRLAFFDPRKLFNADGSPKGNDKLDHFISSCAWIETV